MPVAWRIVEGCAVLESDEVATLEEWKHAVDAALAHEGFKAGMAVVHDLRRMFRVPGPAEARERVEFVQDRSRTHGVSRWAIVVSGTAQYGMGRMAEILSDIARQTDFHVFKDVDDALAWVRGQMKEGGNVA